VGTTSRRGAVLALRECAGGLATVGPDQVFRITLDEVTRVRAELTSGERARFSLSVSRDCGQLEETCVVGGVAEAAGEPVALEVDLEAGAWFLVVDHPVQSGGPFLLELSVVE